MRENEKSSSTGRLLLRFQGMASHILQHRLEVGVITEGPVIVVFILEAQNATSLSWHWAIFYTPEY